VPIVVLQLSTHHAAAYMQTFQTMCERLPQILWAVHGLLVLTPFHPLIYPDQAPEAPIVNLTGIRK